MHPFQPSQIFVDESVRTLPLTARVLNYFHSVKPTYLQDPDCLKRPADPGYAKKTLLITRHKGDPVKYCQGGGDYVCCNYMTVSLVSNCHFECSYCILQDYLKNNPLMTFYANTHEILEWIERKIQVNPTQRFRIGTGELADSLALDSITQHSKLLVPFAASQDNLILELKTKSAEVEGLLGLDHRGKTVVSWSINPQTFISEEEHKTASLDDRLLAARLVCDYGYPVGFHMDPLLTLPGWKGEYSGLIDRLASLFLPSEIAWISLGSLRFTPRLRRVMGERFPRSRLLLGELFPGTDGKVRYFRGIRQDLYHHVKSAIDLAFPGVPHYLCMETKSVWGNVYEGFPADRDELEGRLTQGFAI